MIPKYYCTRHMFECKSNVKFDKVYYIRCDQRHKYILLGEIWSTNGVKKDVDRIQLDFFENGL